MQASVSALDNEFLINSMVKKDKASNPFLLGMNLKITLKTWLKYAKMRLSSEAVAMLTKAGHKNLDSTLGFEKPKMIEVPID